MSCAAGGADDSCHASPPFPSLETISLSGNRVGDWGAVDRLAGLPALRSLRFSANPVTSGLGASEVRERIEVVHLPLYTGSVGAVFTQGAPHVTQARLQEKRTLHIADDP